MCGPHDPITQRHSFPPADAFPHILEYPGLPVEARRTLRAHPRPHFYRTQVSRHCSSRRSLVYLSLATPEYSRSSFVSTDAICDHDVALHQEFCLDERLKSVVSAEHVYWIDDRAILCQCTGSTREPRLTFFLVACQVSVPDNVPISQTANFSKTDFGCQYICFFESPHWPCLPRFGSVN